MTLHKEKPVIVCERRTEVCFAALWIFILPLLLFGCGRKAVVVPPEVTLGHGWAYRMDAPRTFHVFAESNAALQEAMKAIGCGICSLQHTGDIYEVGTK